MAIKDNEVVQLQDFSKAETNEVVKNFKPLIALDYCYGTTRM